MTAWNVQGLNLLAREAGSDTLYYMYNGHADVTSLVYGTGAVAATYYYDAFGNITEQTVTDSVYQPFKYAGYQYDDETGLYYLNARYYDSKIARFLTEDTYRGQAYDPLSLNLYTYCLNNPIMYWDPTGHWAETDKDLSTYKQIEIAKLTIAWEAANKAGDKSLMDEIHQKADDVRAGKSVGYIYADTNIVLNEIINLQTGYTKLDSKSATITHDYANALRDTVKASFDYIETDGDFHKQVDKTFNNQSYIGGNTVKQTNDLAGTLSKEKEKYDALESKTTLLTL